MFYVYVSGTYPHRVGVPRRLDQHFLPAYCSPRYQCELLGLEHSLLFYFFQYFYISTMCNFHAGGGRVA